MTFSFRSMFGGQLFDLPDFQSVNLGFENSDVGGVTLVYPLDGINASSLTEDTVIIAYFNGAEVDNGRWVVQAQRGKNVQDAAPVITKLGKSLADIFRRIVVLPGVATDFELTFTNVTAGAMWNTLLTRARDRGALTGITWDFTATNDSSGQPWNRQVTQKHKVGQKYLTMLRQHASQGLVEWRFRGTVLQMFSQDQRMGRDLTLGANPVELFAGLDYTETPFQSTVEERAGFVIVIGDEGNTVEFNDVQAPIGPFGREEISIAQGGTKDVGVLLSAGQVALEQVAGVRAQYTRQVLLGHSRFEPIRDYNIGDFIFERVDGVARRYRVAALVLTLDQGGGRTAALVLNDRLQERDIELARTLDGVTGGASIGGTGVPTPPPTSSRVVPGPVTNLTFTTSAYFDAVEGNRTLITATWTAPAANTDGSVTTDVERYHVTWTGLTPSRFTTFEIVGGTTATISNLVGDSSVRLSVRAANKVNNLSSEVILNVISAKDTAAPAVPSAPVVSMILGQASVAWDGLNAAGGGYNSTLQFVELHRSTVSNFTPVAATRIDTAFVDASSVAIARLVLNGSFGGLAYGTTYFYRLITRGNNGFASGPSVQASTTPLRVSGLDINQLTIDTANLANGAFTSIKVADAAIIRAKIADLAVDDAKIDNLNVGKLTAGVLNADITVSQRIKTAETGARAELNYLGLQLFDSLNRPTLMGSSADGSLTIMNNNAVVFRANTNGVYVQGEIDATSGKIGTARIDAAGLAVGMPGNDITLDAAGGIKAYRANVVVFNLVPGEGTFIAPGLRAVQAQINGEVGTSSGTLDTVAGTPQPVFAAPASGNVRLDYSCWVRNDLGSDLGSGVMSAEVLDRTTDFKVLVGSERQGCTASGIRRNSIQNFIVVSGLTPGVTYYARLVFRTGDNGGTAYFFYTRLCVTPQP